ncbi:hypothetical protein HCN44_002920 [Aphidius gifuensis]|uniref:Alpha-(1,6)-fucosyltransferase n=1 Tax=Aphidius gifuensis TaxID=684658 RepID=A0A834XRR5_APHGI|nr:alpha-(1,6)-fucosyltransferase [Aphidius gifuensis]KAF7991358.1 hypothetical protein HCN44_002920 [Aphidius gifuensis]
MAIWNGRPSWLGKLGIILLSAWLIVLIYSVSQMLRSSPSLSSSLTAERYQSQENEYTKKLTEITKDFNKLKKQNQALTNILLAANNNNNDNNELKDKVDIELLANNRQSGPTIEYEELRRKLRNDIQETWYYINAELMKIKKRNNDNFVIDDDHKNDIDNVIYNIFDHKKELMMDMNKLEKFDGHMDWREQEAHDLSDLVQRRFYYLQNPSNCDKAKKLVCSLNKGCGFGCQIHHITYCFLVAYGTERTLILRSQGWRYQKNGWESVFKPLSDNCLIANGESHSNWPGDNTKQVVILPIVDNVYPKPKYQPPSVPLDLVPRIKKLHGHPLVWWVGQVLKYLMRLQDNNIKKLNESKEKLGFKKPIVGIHVRRTDKVGTEAAYHDIDEYMAKVEQWYNQNFDNNESIIRRVFIASDDPKVIINARNKYKNYEIIGDPAIAETASVSNRYSDASLQGIINDIHLLSLCDHIVCTFSSQVCRVAYELMQTYHIDAHDKFTSLDDIYYYGGQNPNPHVAIIEHIPKNLAEIELKIGDKIDVYGNHWDGYSKGRNARTSITGLFPSFKVQNPIAAVEFPKYQQVPIYTN